MTEHHTTSRISSEQNSVENLKLLKAQRQLYSEAKRFRYWRLRASIGLALTAPIILFFLPTRDSGLFAIGAILLGVDRLLFKRLEDTKVKQAATIQEELDTRLFDLPWNYVLVGDKVTPETVSLAAHRFKGGETKLQDWYPNTDNVPYPLDVLICQRVNLVWDWQLRRHYATLVAAVTALYLVFLVGFAIMVDNLLLDFLLGLLFPTLAAIIEGVEVSRDHFRIAREKEDTARKILDLWEQGLKDPNAVSQNDCRSIQDCVFLYRSGGPLVPDWWYDRLRDMYEIDMYDTARRQIAQVKS